MPNKPSNEYKDSKVLNGPPLRGLRCQSNYRQNEPADYLMDRKTDPVECQALKQKDTTTTIKQPTQVPNTGDKRKKRNRKPRTALEGRLESDENKYNNSSVDSSSTWDSINFKYGGKLKILLGKL